MFLICNASNMVFLTCSNIETSVAITSPQLNTFTILMILCKNPVVKMFIEGLTHNCMQVLTRCNQPCMLVSLQQGRCLEFWVP